MSSPVNLLLSFDNPVFRTYLLFSGILVIKIILMGPLTSRFRMTKKIFSNPEDTVLREGSIVKYDDPEIERVRRAHLNDLENIPAFLFISLVYVLTNPQVWLAKTLFVVFTLARLVHTFVYAVFVIPQPARAVAFYIGYFITLYMGFMAILTFYNALWSN